MLALHADDWFTITGRGRVASISPDQIPAGEAINQGDQVNIDGSAYVVNGIEVARTLTDPPKMIGYGLQVREVAGT